MKTLHLIFVLLLTVVSIQASNLTESPTTTAGGDAALLNQTESTLLNHIWYQGDARLLFSPTGIVSIVEDDWLINYNVWDVYVENSAVYMNLMRSDGSNKILRIEQTGETLAWIDLNKNEELDLRSSPIKNNKTTLSLVGTWRSTIYPTTVVKDLSCANQTPIKSADFRYNLKTDGTFTKTLVINRTKEDTTNGVWQISADGKFVILHIQNTNDTYDTYMAEIKYLAFDELVLSQPLVTSDLESRLCHQMKTFFFNKQ